MRTTNISSVKGFFEFQELITQSEQPRMEAELRALSLRIPVESHDILERFSQRWGDSKSSLAASLLEVALNDLEHTERQEQAQKARGAAL